MLILIWGENRKIFHAQFSDYQPLEDVILTEPAGTCPRRHKESGPVGIKSGLQDLFHHIASCYRAGIAFLSGDEFFAYVYSLACDSGSTSAAVPQYSKAAAIAKEWSDIWGRKMVLSEEK